MNAGMKSYRREKHLLEDVPLRTARENSSGLFPIFKTSWRDESINLLVQEGAVEVNSDNAPVSVASSSVRAQLKNSRKAFR
jgi:hypothetical protein